MKPAILTALLLLPTYVFADGSDLLRKCSTVLAQMDGSKSGAVSPTDGLDFGFCLGFMQGVTNMIGVYKIKPTLKDDVCLPEAGIPNGQAARIVVKFMRENPAYLHGPEVTLAVLAFRDASRVVKAAKPLPCSLGKTLCFKNANLNVRRPPRK